MTEALKTYQGNCHCGANRFEVQLPNLPPLAVCDCALCAKKGHVWIYDAEGRLEITRGCTEETLTTYTSSAGASLQHQFCSTCGTGMFGTHQSGVLAGKRGINLRSLISRMTGVFLKGKEIITLDVDGNIQPYAGKLSFAESVATSAVTKHEFSGQLPDLTEEQPVLYTGACDCGAIQVAVRSKPLSDVEIKEDNCSICIRNGTVGLYPHQSQVTIAGRENTRDYAFGRKFNGAPFCQTCGVHCFGNLYGPPKEIVARLPEAKQEFVRKQLEVQPLNVRVMDNVDWAEMDIKWSNEGTEGYQLKD